MYTDGRIKSTRNDTTLLTEGDSSASPCRANQTLHSQLGLDNTGPMGVTVCTGFCLPLTMTPTQTVAPAEMAFSVEQQSLISVGIQTLIQKGAVSLQEPHQVGFIFQLFLVPKKSSL